MGTNGLSLKPCDSLPPVRLLHSGHGAPRNFLQPCPAVGKLFPRPFSRSMDSREIRRLRALPGHARLYRERDYVTYHLNGGRKSIKRRLRTVSLMLQSSPHLKRAYSRVRGGHATSFTRSFCVWHVETQHCTVQNLDWHGYAMCLLVYTPARLPICGVYHRQG
jgi:hypothetical protein